MNDMDLVFGELNRDAAAWLLELRFTLKQENRMLELAELGNRGELSPEMKEEMARYRAVGNVLSLLKARVRLFLNQ
jgi:hypothetical protein